MDGDDLSKPYRKQGGRINDRDSFTRVNSVILPDFVLHFLVYAVATQKDSRDTKQNG